MAARNPAESIQHRRPRCARNPAVVIAACENSIGSPCRAQSYRGHRFTRMNGGASRSYPRPKKSSKFRRSAGDSNRSKSCLPRCGRTPASAAFIRSRPDFLMLDALGNAQGFDDSKAAVLRYLSRCPQGDGWIRFGTRAGASADVGRALALLGTRAAGDQGRTRPNRSNYGSRDSGAEANRNLQFEASAEPGPGCRKLRRSANFSQVAFNRSSASYKILQCFLGKPFGYGLAKVWLRFGYTVEFDRSTEKPENRLQIPIRFSNKTPFGLLENGF